MITLMVWKTKVRKITLWKKKSPQNETFHEFFIETQVLLFSSHQVIALEEALSIQWR